MSIVYDTGRCTNPHMTDIARLVRDLRTALGLSQETLAERGGIRRDAVTKVETGANKASSALIRAGLARGLGLPPADLEAYLEGKITLSQAKERAKQGTALIESKPAEEIIVTHPDDLSPLEQALTEAFDKQRHNVRDINAVQAVLRNTAQLLNTDSDLVEAGKAWLDCAAQLRLEGLPVTAEHLLVRLTVSRKALPLDVAKAKKIDEEDEERQKQEFEAENPGRTWGDSREAVEKLWSKKKKPIVRD